MPTLTVSCFEEFHERAKVQDFEITTYTVSYTHLTLPTNREV